MDRAPIEQIRRIVARLPGVERPEARPPAQRPDDPAALIALFAARLADLRAPGDFEPALLRVPDLRRLHELLAEFTRATPPADIVWFGREPHAPRDARLGISPALALIAATGSVVVDLPRAQAAAASLLVDTHVVVADTAALVADLESFYARLADWRTAGRAGGCQVCITGCSRTADIEKTLVIPAHGPRRVVVLLCDEPVDWKNVAGTSNSPA